MDTAHWPQDLGLVKPMEELMSSTSSSSAPNNAAAVVVFGSGGSRPLQQQQQQPLMGGGERRARPQKEQALNCPRCNSTNTKFCYYNNYSLTQPRYFCKTCRRYWTEGGSLRNVPVGGGSRKNKRSSSSSSSNSPSSTAATSSAAVAASAACSTKTVMPEQNPKFHEGQDLNLAFPLPEFGDASANVPASASGALSAMELLRSTGIQGRSLNAFVPMNPMTIPEYHHPSSGFGVQDFRPNSLSFPLDGSASGGYGGLQESSTGMILFPFDESRPVASSSSGGGGGDGSGAAPPGFWNGLMGSGGGGAAGGSSW